MNCSQSIFQQNIERGPPTRIVASSDADKLPIRIAQSVIQVPQVMDHQQLEQMSHIRTSLLASMQIRNLQLREIIPNLNPQIEQITPTLDNLPSDLDEATIGIEQSQIIVQGGLSIIPEQVTLRMEGMLLKKSSSLISPYKPKFCVYEDGILRIFNEGKKHKAKSILNFYLFNFKYCKINPGPKVEEFAFRCEDVDKIFQFKGEKASEWFKTIRQAIDEQRIKPKFNYFIRAFPNYYKKHLIHNNQFQEMTQSGDILLFQSKCVSGKMQRVLTQSNYDHVAMVLRYRNGQIYVLEATGSMGVGIFQWDSMMSKGWCELYSMVVCRRLEIERTSQFLLKLESFARENLGKEYKLSVSKLLTDKSQMLTSQNQQTYFCSQLIAAAYKHIGLLNSDLCSTQYWPGSFSNEKQDLQLVVGSLSDEYLIGFNM